MIEILTLIKHKLLFLYSYCKAAILGFLYQKKYETIKNVCLFIGYPRSGHSLIAALLDANPDIVIGMEWGVFPHLELGYRKRQIFYSLLRNSYLFKKRRNNIWTGYSYKIQDSWQGKVRKLLVIGDKHGGRASLMLRKNPELMHELERIIKFRPKLIHVIRNPFDMITTHTLKYFEDFQIPGSPEGIDLLPQIQKFFYRADVIMQLKKAQEYDMLDIYHEEFIKDPKVKLKEILIFLGLESDKTYLESCAAIIYSVANQSRQKIEWPNELIKFVENRLCEYPFLSHYKYSH